MEVHQQLQHTVGKVPTQSAATLRHIDAADGTTAGYAAAALGLGRVVARSDGAVNQFDDALQVGGQCVPGILEVIPVACKHTEGLYHADGARGLGIFHACLTVAAGRQGKSTT